MRGQHLAPAALSTGRNPIKAGRHPEPVPTIWEREQSLTSAGIRTPNPPTRNLVNIPSKLPRLFRTFTSKQSPNSLKLLQDINSYFDRQNVAQTKMSLIWSCSMNVEIRNTWQCLLKNFQWRKAGNLVVGGKIILKRIFDKYCCNEFGLVIGSSLLMISGHCINVI